MRIKGLLPGKSLPLFNYATALYAAGQAKGALPIIDKAIATDAKPAMALKLRSQIYASLGEHGKAQSDLKRAVALDPALGKTAK